MWNLVGFLAMSFIGMTMINRIAEGAFIGSSEIAVLNTLTITRDQELFNMFTMPILNADFFFTGIPALLKWDYDFFGGNAAFFQYMLYAFSGAMAFILFLAVVGAITSIFARR